MNARPDDVEAVLRMSGPLDVGHDPDLFGVLLSDLVGEASARAATRTVRTTPLRGVEVDPQAVASFIDSRE